MFSFLCRPLPGGVQPYGGWRQRLAQPVPAVWAPSFAALGQLQDWGDGIASAKQVCRHLSNYVRDGETLHPMIHRIVDNCRGDVNSGVAAQGLVTLVERCGFDRLVSPVDNSYCSHLCLPSALLKCIYDHYPQKFADILGARPDVLEDYWNHMMRDQHWQDHVRNHPVLRTFTAAKWRQVIPIAIHEDAGPFTKNSGCNVISWSGLLGAGGERISQFIIGSHIKESGPSDQVKLANLWGAILGDFQRLLTNAVGGFFFVLVHAKGDLEVRSNVWGLPHYNGVEICSECAADRLAMPYTDLSVGAAWRRGLVGSAAAFRARARVPHAPPPGGILFLARFFPDGLDARG